MRDILKLLENNGHLSSKDIAVMLGRDEAEVASVIKELEEKKIIVGYKTLIDWDKVDDTYVSALITLKVTPQLGEGFDGLAEQLYSYHRIKSIWLMSGAFDIALLIKGHNIKEVALFVAEKLAPMDGVISTGTHFMLKTYKDYGEIFSKSSKDERGVFGA